MWQWGREDEKNEKVQLAEILAPPSSVGVRKMSGEILGMEMRWGFFAIRVRCFASGPFFLIFLPENGIF
ncbi:MAG: hypothetical protein WC858_06030 [Parcubacteria group bacterium]|jgi:hypothetical protein